METPKNYTEEILKSADKPQEKEQEQEVSPKERLSKATQERVKIEREIDNTLRTYEKALYSSFNLKTPETSEDTKALNLFKQVQILRAKMIGANMEKLEQLVLEFNTLNGKVAEFLNEDRNPIESQRINVAFNKATDSSEKEAQPTNMDTETATAEQKTQVRDPENLSSLDYLTEDVPVETENESRAFGETDLTEVVSKVEAEQKLEDEKLQKENQVSEKLEIINGEMEPPQNQKLLRQIWKLSHDKLGNLVSVSAHSDNANLVFEFKDGSKKIVEPNAIDKFAKRSFNAFEEKYLSKLEAFKERVTELDFEDGLEDKAEKMDLTAEEKDKEEKPSDDQFASLDEKSGTDILRGKGDIRL